MNVRDYMHTARQQAAKVIEMNEENERTKLEPRTKDETSEQNKNKDLGMYIYKVLASRSKVIEERRHVVSQRVMMVAQQMMAIALEREPMFEKFFSNPLIGQKPEVKLDSTDVNHYEIRIYLKSFPILESFQTVSGIQKDVPTGSAFLRLNPSLGRVEKMIIRGEWSTVMDDNDLLSPRKLMPWFVDGIIKSARSLQLDETSLAYNKLQVKPCRTGVLMELLVDGIEGAEKGADSELIMVKVMLSVRGTGLPKGLRIQHALPSREPYVSQGKKVIDKMNADIAEGKSLYNLDAYEGDLWSLDLSEMNERVINGVRQFGHSNIIDPSISLVQLLSMARCWDIPTSIIQSAALWELKKNASWLKTEAQCFTNLLIRLQGYMKAQSCPHFLLANFNLIKQQDPTWCSSIAEDLAEVMAALEDEPSSIQKLTGTKRREKAVSVDIDRHQEDRANEVTTDTNPTSRTPSVTA